MVLNGMMKWIFKWAQVKRKDRRRKISNFSIYFIVLSMTFANC